MNRWWLLVAAILLLPLAYTIGTFSGVSLLGVLAAGAFIVTTIRRTGETS